MLILNHAFLVALLPEDAPPSEVTKERAMEILEISKEKLGSVLQRFKKFLRINKENEWVLLIGKNAQKERIYHLQKFSNPQ